MTHWYIQIRYISIDYQRYIIIIMDPLSQQLSLDDDNEEFLQLLIQRQRLIALIWQIIDEPDSQH